MQKSVVRRYPGVARVGVAALALVLVAGAAAAPAFAQAPPVGAVEGQNEKPLRFYGFAMDFSVYDSSGLNGTYYTNTLDFYFLPNWQVGRLLLKGTRFERLILGGRFVLSRPLSGFDEGYFNQYSDLGPAKQCANLQTSTQGGIVDVNQVGRCDVPSNYRWDYGDIVLSLIAPRVYTIPVLGININPGIVGTIPASAQSRYQTLRFALGGTLGLNRGFLGRLNARYTFGFTKLFQQYTTPRASEDGAPLQNGFVAANYNLSQSFDASLVDATTDIRTNPYFFSTVGGRNPNFGLSHIFGLDITATEALSFSVMYILRQSFPYTVPCVVDYANLDGINVCENGSVVAAKSGSDITLNPQRVSQIFWVSAGYQINDWLNVSASLVTASPQKAPDNSYRQPFLYLNANGFSSVSLGASVSIDHILDHLF